MSDESARLLTMVGTREAIKSGFLQHVERQVEYIENWVTTDTGMVFDLAKSLVESACKAVLSERSVPFSISDDLPKLFRRVKDNVPMLPPQASGEAEVRRGLVQTLSGLQQVLQGICDLRNTLGEVSHGSERERPEMETTQALLAAQAADTMIGFLHRVHRQGRDQAQTSSLDFDSSPEFNDWVDLEHRSVQIFDSEFRPSEVLFQMEPESYRVYLAEFLTRDLGQEAGE